MIRGLGHGDEIVDGRGEGADNLIDYGVDTSADCFSGDGTDTVQSRDVPALRDTVSCGTGTDTVYAEGADIFSGDCGRNKAW